MKQQKPALLAVLLYGFSMCFVSCKKDNNSDAAQCRVTDIKSNDSISSEYGLSYNADKKISVITLAPYKGKRLFTYSGNFIFRAVMDSSGNIIQSDTLSLNKNGLVSSIASYFVGNGSHSYEAMVYDSKNQLIGVTGASASNTFVNYTWRNGDMVSIKYITTDTEIMNYYTDKPADNGDYLRIMSFTEWGLPLFKCNHLFKGSGNNIFTYTYDADGKITSVLNNRTVLYTYTYSCD